MALSGFLDHPLANFLAEVEGTGFLGPLLERARGRCEHPFGEFPRALPLERSVRMMLIVVPPKGIDLLLRVLQ